VPRQGRARGDAEGGAIPLDIVNRAFADEFNETGYEVI